MLHDFSQSEAVIRGEFLAMLSAWQSPSVLYRAKIFPFPDGDAWCCLYGENIQDGVCAFGATPAEAARNFDWYVWHGKPVPEANLDAERETVKELEKWRINVTAALLRPGGAFYEDVPKHVKEMAEQLSQLQALVRAYGEAKVAFDEGRLREDHHAWKERFNKLELAEAALIDYTMRTLDASGWREG